MEDTTKTAWEEHGTETEIGGDPGTGPTRVRGTQPGGEGAKRDVRPLRYLT